MTPYVEALLLELSNDLPSMAASMSSAAFREAALFRCSEILTVAPQSDRPSATLTMERLREVYRW